uniref:Complex 1 LYR protein domain-containing protein n=1 Tax=Gopherus agassizii TaxID=38772 RepID=A0A452I0K9_9SAUR
MARHSKLQKQVLSLYRQFLRAGKEKPGFLPRIQAEFRKNASIPRMDVMHIEYLLRRGQRQLKQLRDVNTKQMGGFRSTLWLDSAAAPKNHRTVRLEGTWRDRHEKPPALRQGQVNPAQR